MKVPQANQGEQCPWSLVSCAIYRRTGRTSRSAVTWQLEVRNCAKAQTDLTPRYLLFLSFCQPVSHPDGLPRLDRSPRLRESSSSGSAFSAAAVAAHGAAAPSHAPHTHDNPKRRADACCDALSANTSRAMHSMRIFPAHMGAGGGAAALNPRFLVLGGVVILLVMSALSMLTRHDAAKIAALERKLAFLEAKEAQSRLNIAQEVQKALSSDLATMMAGGHTLTGGSRTYPAILRLPAHLQKRILLTGGAGFVGSHLLDALMLQGHSVTVLDNLFTGRMANIQHWAGHPNFQFVQHDVTQPFMMEADQIYHLACPASPPHYQYNPIKTIKTSTQGTLNMLGLAKRTYARLLFTSTSEVYGDPEVHPQVRWGRGRERMCWSGACADSTKITCRHPLHDHLTSHHHLPSCRPSHTGAM